MDTITAHATPPATTRAPGRAPARLAAVIGLEVAGVVVLAGGSPRTAVPWHDLARWIDTRPTTEVAMGLLWPLAMILAGYLLATTLLYVAARASGVATLVRATAGWTLPAVRRVSDRAVAAGFVTTTVLAGPAAAASPPPPVASVTADGEFLPPGLRIPAAAEVPPPPPGTAAPAPTPTLEAPPAEGRPARTPVPVPQVAPPADVPVTPPSTGARPPAPGDREVHVVVRGDHLWALAARRVADHRGVPVAEVGDREIAPYWAELVAANRADLRSGDPDLIRPGERIVLPPVPGRSDGQ